MKKILIPTDFSVCAQAATEVALEVAQLFGSKVCFLHLCNDPLISHHAASEKQALEHNLEVGKIRASLNELVLQAERSGVTATQVIIRDKGNEQLVDYIEPYGIDWVVMGSHGITGVRELVLGSNTGRVVRQATVPVLVIKKRPKIISFKNIVFASTFEHAYLGDALKECLDFAKPYHAQIHLLYLNLVDRLVEEGTAQSMMKRLTDLFPLESFTTSSIATNDAEWGIDEFVRHMRGDLIAITPYDTQGVIGLITRRIAVKLVNHEAIPVLVLNAKLPTSIK